MEDKKYRFIFADLDGTLIDTLSGETFPKGVWDMKFKFDVFDKIKEVSPEMVLIVSNQGGIEKGFVNAGNFNSKLDYVCKSIHEYCGCPCYSIYCTSNDKDDKYRKPNTGMLEELCDKCIGGDREEIKASSLMIGDASGKEGQFSDSDKKCAETFGFEYLDIEDFINSQFA